MSESDVDFAAVQDFGLTENVRSFVVNAGSDGFMIFDTVKVKGEQEVISYHP